MRGAGPRVWLAGWQQVRCSPLMLAPAAASWAQDDIYGWDFVSNNNGVFDGVGDDHGTCVRGSRLRTGWHAPDCLRSRHRDCWAPCACTAVALRLHTAARAAPAMPDTHCRPRLPCSHVAGTIGAVGGNGAGVAGVSWGVKMLSGKVRRCASLVLGSGAQRSQQASRRCPAVNVHSPGPPLPPTCSSTPCSRSSSATRAAPPPTPSGRCSTSRP